MSESGAIWARDTVAELSQTMSSFGYTIEPIDVADRGTAVAVRTEGQYFFTVFAAASEGPTRVVLSTGVYRDLSPARAQIALTAANAYQRTRAQGRLAVSETQPGGPLLVSLHTTMLPAILTNVPPFAQSFLGGFAAESRIARKFLRERGVVATSYRYQSASDAALLLDVVDDRTDLLLDFEDLMNGED